MMPPLSCFYQTEHTDFTLEDFDDLEVLYSDLQPMIEDLTSDTVLQCQASQLSHPSTAIRHIFKETETIESWEWEITKARPLCMIYSIDNDDEENTCIHYCKEAESDARDQTSLPKGNHATKYNILKEVSNVTADGFRTASAQGNEYILQLPRLW